MIRLAAILIALVLFCLTGPAYPAFAQGPPDEQSGGASDPDKAGSGINELLQQSVADYLASGESAEPPSSTERGVTTRDTPDRGALGSGRHNEILGQQRRPRVDQRRD